MAVNTPEGIRYLTEKECFRLMGFDDIDFEKIKDTKSSYLYKQAGNSIVVDVLIYLFKAIFKAVNFEENKEIQTTIFDYLQEELKMSEEWKKELLTKYFMATFNFTKVEAENVIKQYFKDEITLEEEKVKEVILFQELLNMATGRPKQHFLLLDINDITLVCGSMYSDELVRLLNIRHNYLSSWLTFNGILDGKYYVVEDEQKEGKKNECT